jgi:RNA polymerase primary sigma factor
MIQCSRHCTPDEHLAHQSLLSDIEQLVKELPSTEQFVLKNRFGFDGAEPKSLKEVGVLLGMNPSLAYTQKRVGRLQKRAFKQLLSSHRTLLEDLRRQIEEDIDA